MYSTCNLFVCLFVSLATNVPYCVLSFYIIIAFCYPTEPAGTVFFHVIKEVSRYDIQTTQEWFFMKIFMNIDTKQGPTVED